MTITGDPYKDHPRKGQLPIKGYEPPAGSQAEKIRKQESSCGQPPTAQRGCLFVLLAGTALVGAAATLLG